jgi:hypothetical protein
MTKETIETREVNEDMEIELYLEDGVYYLLLKSLLEEAEEFEPMAAGEDLDVVNAILQFAVGVGLLSKTDRLIELIRNKIFREVYDLPGTTVLSPSDLVE